MTGEKGSDAKGRGRILTTIQSRHSSGAEEKPPTNLLELLLLRKKSKPDTFRTQVQNVTAALTCSVCLYVCVCLCMMCKHKNNTIILTAYLTKSCGWRLKTLLWVILEIIRRNLVVVYFNAIESLAWDGAVRSRRQHMACAIRIITT